MDDAKKCGKQDKRLRGGCSEVQRTGVYQTLLHAIDMWKNVKHLVGNGSHFYEKLSDAITNRYPLRKYQKYRLIAGLNKTVIFTLIRNIRCRSSWQTITVVRSRAWLDHEFGSRWNLMSYTEICPLLWCLKHVGGSGIMINKKQTGARNNVSVGIILPRAPESGCGKSNLAGKFRFNLHGRVNCQKTFF